MSALNGVLVYELASHTSAHPLIPDIHPLGGQSVRPSHRTRWKADHGPLPAFPGGVGSACGRRGEAREHGDFEIARISFHGPSR